RGRAGRDRARGRRDGGGEGCLCRRRAHRVGRHALPARHRSPRRGARAMTTTAKSVAVLMGSDSDWDVMSAGVKRLRDFGINCEVHVMSAHRTPARVMEYVIGARAGGSGVFIAAAGAAAHLAGVVAAHTTLPVIGVPLNATSLYGLDALLATVQMPSGVPVATVAVGGAENAGIL